MGRNVCMFHAVHTCTHKCTHAHMHKPAHTHTREPIMLLFVNERILLFKHFLCSSLVAMGRLSWYCKDKCGTASGPWTSQQMYDWFASNNLNGGCNVRVRLEACEEWYDVPELFPNIVEAFKYPLDALGRLSVLPMPHEPPHVHMPPPGPPPVNWPLDLNYHADNLVRNQQAWTAYHGRM